MNKYFNYAVKNVLFLPVLLVAMLFTQAVHAECVDNIPYTKPDTLYADNADGTVTDVETGLHWQKCAMGQEPQLHDCAGSATVFNWQQALAQAQKANKEQLYGYDDWRLPSVAELRTLVAKNCHAPAINSSFFPRTPAYLFWSSSPSAAEQFGAWFINFNRGNENTFFKDSHGHVRLVRGSGYQ